MNVLRDIHTHRTSVLARALSEAVPRARPHRGDGRHELAIGISVALYVRLERGGEYAQPLAGLRQIVREATGDSRDAVDGPLRASASSRRNSSCSVASPRGGPRPCA